MAFISKKTYAERAKSHSNQAAKQLLETIERKRSNLCVSVDVTEKSDFLQIIDVVGPYVCLIKASLICAHSERKALSDMSDPVQTHIDIIGDFDEDLIVQLQVLSKKHDFLIFEDRKFADIGMTFPLHPSIPLS